MDAMVVVESSRGRVLPMFRSSGIRRENVLCSIPTKHSQTVPFSTTIGNRATRIASICSVHASADTVLTPVSGREFCTVLDNETSAPKAFSRSPSTMSANTSSASARSQGPTVVRTSVAFPLHPL